MPKTTQRDKLIARKIASANVQPLVQVDKEIICNLQLWCQGLPIDDVRQYLNRLVNEKKISGYQEGDIELYGDKPENPVYNFRVKQSDLDGLGIDRTLSADARMQQQLSL